MTEPSHRAREDGDGPRGSGAEIHQRRRKIRVNTTEGTLSGKSLRVRKEPEGQERA